MSFDKLRMTNRGGAAAFAKASAGEGGWHHFLISLYKSYYERLVKNTAGGVWRLEMGRGMPGHHCCICGIILAAGACGM